MRRTYVTVIYELSPKGKEALLSRGIIAGGAELTYVVPPQAPPDDMQHWVKALALPDGAAAVIADQDTWDRLLRIADSTNFGRVFQVDTSTGRQRVDGLIVPLGHRGSENLHGLRPPVTGYEIAGGNTPYVVEIRTPLRPDEPITSLDALVAILDTYDARREGLQARFEEVQATVAAAKKAAREKTLAKQKQVEAAAKKAAEDAAVWSINGVVNACPEPLRELPFMADLVALHGAGRDWRSQRQHLPDPTTVDVEGAKATIKAAKAAVKALAKLGDAVPPQALAAMLESPGA